MKGHLRTLDFILQETGMILMMSNSSYNYKRQFWYSMYIVCVGMRKTVGKQADKHHCTP